MKGFAGINKINAPEAYWRSWNLSLSLANLGARIALRQLEGGRHFIAEHPKGSKMWSLRIWKKVGEHPQVVNAQIDQCMAGLIGAKSGLPVRKPTEF